MITAQDNEAIAAVISNMAKAWAAGDGKAYGDNFWYDANYVEAPGFRAKGSDVIAARHQAIFDTFFKFSRIDGKYPSEIKPLTADVVLVLGSGNVLFPGETAENVDPNGLMTMCLLKRNSEWKVISFQNTPFGKFRKIKFFWRFLRSKIYMLTAEWKTAQKYMLEEKRRYDEYRK